jgi:hypothetical protein
VQATAAHTVGSPNVVEREGETAAVELEKAGATEHEEVIDDKNMEASARMRNLATGALRDKLFPIPLHLDDPCSYFSDEILVFCMRTQSGVIPSCILPFFFGGRWIYRLQLEIF